MKTLLLALLLVGCGTTTAPEPTEPTRVLIIDDGTLRVHRVSMEQRSLTCPHITVARVIVYDCVEDAPDPGWIPTYYTDGQSITNARNVLNGLTCDIGSREEIAPSVNLIRCRIPS